VGLTRNDFRPYQHRAVEFFKATPRAAGWIFMGGGKTAATLTAFADLQHQFEARRALVVAPLRVARDVWHTETRQWDHLVHLRVSRILGNVDERKNALRAKADVYTINRENLTWLESLFIQNRKQVRPWPFDTVILDESQSYKSQSSKRWKAMRRLGRLTQRIVELTGTPSPNGLPDLWAQAYLLDGGKRLGLTETAYRERWFDPPGYGEFKWKPKKHAETEIYAALGDIVLSLRESDYFDLPPVIPTLVEVQLPPTVRAKYRDMERDLMLETFGGKVVTAANAAVCTGKRMQLANGSIYVDDRGTFEEFHTEKLDALVELLQENNEPVIVVYTFKADYARVLARLAREFGKTRRIEKLDTAGSVLRWNNGETDILLLHPESAGHGLNLQHSGCQQIIWFGLTYNLEHIQQVAARLGGGHRRKGHLAISYIVASCTVDDEVLASIKGKALTQERLIEAVAAFGRTYAENPHRIHE
jgi:SNF2-related domain